MIRPHTKQAFAELIMELTVDQALQKGIEAHKAGQFQDADRLYTAILKSQPKHPDANHNMGVLAVGVGKVEQALPFFKTALEANLSTAQFWLSYIEALIKLEQLAEAKAVLDQATSKGAKGDGFNQLEQKLQRIEPIARITPRVQDPPQDQIQSLINLYSQGQLKQALEQATRLLQQFPNSSVLYNISGAIYNGLSQLDASVEAYNSALAIKPNSAEAYNNMGNVLKDQGKLDEALEAYTKALLLKPDLAETYYNMGIALKAQDKLEEAIEAYNKAIAIKPDYADAYNNMGFALSDQGKLEEAIAAYNKALAIRPDYAEAYYNMGNAFQEQGKLEEAMEAYTKALAIKRDYAEAYSNMGATLSSQGKLEKAIEAYNKALALKPDYAEAYNNMGVTLQQQGNLEEAIEAYSRALAIRPDYGNAKHMLASLTGETTNSAPREYVENLFDGYAGKFDQSLVEKLEYNIPKILTNLTAKEHGSGSWGSVLDLGCGTGLTGIEIKEFCSKLEGIDLSNKMLEQAKITNVYDKLTHVDIVDYLSIAELNFDYFISTDVFVYVGNLSEVFRLIKSRNKKPGKLVFSTEHTENDGFHLEKSGRYSHSKRYIESLCEKFSYSISHFSETNLRKEKGAFLTGGIYLLDF